MIKAIFFDIDGTLLDFNGHVSKRTRDALTVLRNKGIKIFVATGRHRIEIEQVALNNMVFDGYVTLNGQLCLNKNHKLIHGVKIDAQDCKKLISIFNQKEYPCLIIQKDKMYINFVNDLVRKVQDTISTPIPPIEEYLSDNIYQFCVYGDESAINNIFNQLNNCKMTKWNKYGADIISKNGGKVVGINYFINLMRINKSEVMAIGDGENDIEMLRDVGIGVAMGNADETVKNAADLVTLDVDHDGVYFALKELKVI